MLCKKERPIIDDCSIVPSASVLCPVEDAWLILFAKHLMFPVGPCVLVTLCTKERPVIDDCSVVPSASVLCPAACMNAPAAMIPNAQRSNR